MTEAAGAPKARKFRGEVFIDWDRCKGCGFCIDFCPPKVLAFSAEFNGHGYHPPYLAKEDACTGCDLCGLYCPDFAIHGARVAKTDDVMMVDCRLLRSANGNGHDKTRTGKSGD